MYYKIRFVRVSATGFDTLSRCYSVFALKDLPHTLCIALIYNHTHNVGNVYNVYPIRYKTIQKRMIEDYILYVF